MDEGRWLVFFSPWGRERFDERGDETCPEDVVVLQRVQGSPDDAVAVTNRYGNMLRQHVDVRRGPVGYQSHLEPRTMKGLFVPKNDEMELDRQRSLETCVVLTVLDSSRGPRSSQWRQKEGEGVVEMFPTYVGQSPLGPPPSGAHGYLCNFPFFLSRLDQPSDGGPVPAFPRCTTTCSQR